MQLVQTSVQPAVRKASRPPGTASLTTVTPGEKAARQPESRLAWRHRRTPFLSSLGGALVFEALLVAGMIWLAATHHAAPPPAVPKRIAVHVVEPSPSPKPQPVPVIAPTAVAAPTQAVYSPPVIAIPSAMHLEHPTFQVPILPPPPPVTTVAPDDTSILARYTSMLRAATQADLKVPGMVQAMRLQGIATVVFKLAPAGGHVLWTRLAHSSGIPMIDAAALAKVKSTVYPPFLPGLPQHDSTFKIAVRLSGVTQR